MPEDDGGAGDGTTTTYTPPATQEEFDRLVQGRLARERAKFADYDDLKAKAAKFDEADAASKTELQKLQDAVAERDTKLADLPREVRKQAIRFASMAAQKGFLDPEDALVFIDADLADEDAVKAALDDLAERKPHLVKAPAKKLPARPKPKPGDDAEDPADGAVGKERAAAALRQMRSTR
jgi:peptidoglycan hydrolase CwlO-like protein